MRPNSPIRLLPIKKKRVGRNSRKPLKPKNILFWIYAFQVLKRRAGYGNRTRLPGLGSPCTTDVLIPQMKKITLEKEPILGLEPRTYALRMRCSTN